MMQYLAIIDKDEIGEHRVFGDGKRMRSQCLEILKFAYRNDDKELSITKIASGTGLPRMNIDFILRDYACRGEKSALHKTAEIYKYDFTVHKEWNGKDKYKRVKKIITANKK